MADNDLVVDLLSALSETPLLLMLSSFHLGRFQKATPIEKSNIYHPLRFITFWAIKINILEKLFNFIPEHYKSPYIQDSNASSHPVFG